MKINKISVFTLLLVGATSFSSCKKEDMSKYATKEDLAQAKEEAKSKVYNFTLTYNQTDYVAYAPTITKTNPNDLILTFVHWDDVGGQQSWMQCPLTIGNLFIAPEFTNSSLIIGMYRADGVAGSPFNQTASFNFKVVVVSVKSLNANPTVDLSNYEEVKEAFNLVD